MDEGKREFEQEKIYLNLSYYHINIKTLSKNSQGENANK